MEFKIPIYWRFFKWNKNMANPYTSYNLSPTRRSEEEVFGEVLRHSQTGFDETDKRTTGTQRVGSISFNEADELFRSWLDEKSWPYDALMFDPRIFTFIFEKASRLIANKPRGRLIPREGSDVLAAKINNSILDYQWDQADHGGAMIAKWAMMDMNTRKYGAAFALCKWRYEEDKKGRVVFDGPEMKLINNRDFAHDLSATAIENANWVQVRQYVTFQELERVNDQARGKPIYKNLKELREAIARDGEGSGGGDTRGVNWISRNRVISKLEQDPVGKDNVFKTVEIITEYRRDRWITIARKHGVVIRDMENPYKNYEIPVTMLRYYAIDDDLYGLSEIEPVKGPMKAINALLCQYVDEINQNLYSPIAIGPGVRQHTLEWGKGARWIMNNPMTDFRVVEGKSNAAAYFNNTYSVLVSSMMNALGESSLGVSNIQPFQRDKTATEVRAVTSQRNARDNFNQIFLGEAIKRQLMLWHTMNQTMLFSDEKKQYYVVRIAGKDTIKYFQQKQLDATETIKELEGGQNLEVLENAPNAEALVKPKFPVNIGTEKKPKEVTKLKLDDSLDGGELYAQPEDVKGNFDFIVDVQSMTLEASEERKQTQQVAMQMLVGNPNVAMMLAQEGIKPKFKELFVTWLEDLGFSDADRFFEKMPSGQGQPAQGMPQTAGAQTVPMPNIPTPEANGQANLANQPNADLGEPNPAILRRLQNRFPEGGQIGY